MPVFSRTFTTHPDSRKSYIINSVNLNEKILYHQIYPIKLEVDWLTGLYGLYLLRRRAWFNKLWLVPVGILITLFGWFKGLLGTPISREAS